MWEKIRRKLKDLDFVFDCLQKATDVCYFLGGALLIVGLWSLEYKFLLTPTKCLAALFAASVVICGIFLYLGQNADDDGTKQGAQQEADKDSSRVKWALRWSVIIACQVSIVVLWLEIIHQSGKL